MTEYRGIPQTGLISRLHGRDLSPPFDFQPSLGVLAEAIAAAREDLVEVVLGPPDVGVEAGKLPHAVNLAVVVSVVAVGVALDLDSREACVGVDLVRHAQLVVADDFGIRHLLPLAGTSDEVLCAQEGVAEYRRIRDHANELLGGHRLPELVEE